MEKKTNFQIMPIKSVNEATPLLFPRLYMCSFQNPFASTIYTSLCSLHIIFIIMFFSNLSGGSMHSGLVGLLCLAIASAICCSSVGSSNNIMCLESERHALLQFKQGLVVVDDSNALASWENKKDCCKWREIACNNQTGHVITLDLSYIYVVNFTKLRGEISPSLLELRYLNYLDLSYIDFGENMIPKFIGSLSQLKELKLVDANFSGHVPPQLGNLSNLHTLDLSYNKLNGSVPESLGQLSSLEWLALSNNSFTGVITEAHFLNLSRLQSLDVSDNPALSINPSSDWNPPFQLTDELDMTSCKVGPAFPKWILKLTNLTHLYLSNAGLSGSLPNNFWDLFPDLDKVDLSMNQIHGKLPNMSAASMSMLDLSSNILSGALPSISGMLESLHLSNNMFSRPLSSLCATLDAQFFVHLDLSENLLSGELPNCWTQFQGLSMLVLGKNKLSGKIPSSLGNVKGIMILSLKQNNFSGEVPSLENCTGLKVLDLGDNNLSGQIPTWMGQSLTNLAILRLRSNEFSGIIPSSLCNIATIHVLDLSHNNISGGLPHCFNNITILAIDIDYSDGIGVDVVWKGIEREFGENLDVMRSIDMSSNCLVGEIPQSLASMTELISLNLSRNYLTGKLPENFGNMKKLESLDLSGNQISGKIPASFASLNFLSVLNLSYNNLSGRIPTSTQLQSFNASNYMGNLGLCGPPLTQSCPGDGTVQDDGIARGTEIDNKEQVNDGLISLGFFISVVLGFVTGFWMVCGSLLLKTSWRYAYFRFLDKAKDWIYVKTVVYKAKVQRTLQR